MTKAVGEQLRTRFFQSSWTETRFDSKMNMYEGPTGLDDADTRIGQRNASWSEPFSRAGRRFQRFSDSLVVA